jgi:formylglycine-generating enzyme required for sulfatase activity
LLDHLDEIRANGRNKLKGNAKMISSKLKILFYSLIMLAFIMALGDDYALAQEKTFINSIGMEFVLIPAGTFTMGGDIMKEDAWNDEEPRHKVTISKPFYYGKFEVTQAEWKAVMGGDPSSNKGARNPVENISWEEAKEFVARLNKKEKHSRYRLPTEAEWEYAARAGTNSDYFFGNDAGELKNYAWNNDNSDGSSHPVGEKLPNPWGLYDVFGNVDEWVEDFFQDDYYTNSPSADPQGPSSGDLRVLRGCSYASHPEWDHCRLTKRDYMPQNGKSRITGFRLVLDVK